jgi:hypothetical protein
MAMPVRTVEEDARTDSGMRCGRSTAAGEEPEHEDDAAGDEPCLLVDLTKAIPEIRKQLPEGLRQRKIRGSAVFEDALGEKQHDTRIVP